MNYKYGVYTSGQITELKKNIRRQIYFLLLIVDPKTREDYKNIDVNNAFANTMVYFAGLNDLLNNPPEIVRVMGLLEAALIEFNSNNFCYKNYRKLILDAGSEVLKIKEV